MRRFFKFLRDTSQKAVQWREPSNPAAHHWLHDVVALNTVIERHFSGVLFDKPGTPKTFGTL
jgi:hypothetical protein